jgi:hypothetical protein
MAFRGWIKLNIERINTGIQLLSTQHAPAAISQAETKLSNSETPINDSSVISDFTPEKEFKRTPLSGDENRKALDHLDKSGMDGGKEPGIYKKGWFFHTKISVDQAIEELEKGKPVFVKNENGKYTGIPNFNSLQEMDSLKGRGNNTILPQNQFDALKFLEKGIDSNDGLFDPGFFGDSKINSYDALQQTKKGEELEVNVGSKDKEKVKDLSDLAELDSFYGSGKNSVLPDDQFSSMKFFDTASPESGYFITRGKKEKRVDAYQALQNMQAKSPVFVKHQGHNEQIITPEDVKELDALEGRGENNILPVDQFESLKGLSDNLYNNEQIIPGKLTSYKALQALQAGKTVEYRLKGGDFGETLDQDIKSLGELPDAKKQIENQVEYDKFRFTFPEYSEKTGKVAAKTPELAKHALDDSNRDLERAEDLPEQIKEKYTTTEYEYHYGYNWQNGKYEYHYGNHEVEKERWVHNNERDDEIRRANRKLGNAQEVGKKLPEMQAAIARINEQNFAEKKEELKTLLSEMQKNASGCSGSLERNIKRLKSLVSVMESRPERPAGWVSPEPRVENY